MAVTGRTFTALALCAALLPQILLAQTTVHLKPGDNLAAALTSATPGTVIELAAGDYGALALKRVSGAVGKPIVLRSADQEKPARITEMDLREVSHLVLDGLQFDYTYSVEDKGNIRPFQIFATRDLTIRNSDFDGDIADSNTPEGESYPTGYGLAVRSSAEIRIENNNIHDFYRGLVISDCVDVAVIGNDVHAIRMDGMNFAQVERVLIEGNMIRDFKRAVASADHADMIQFWTNKTKRPNTDIIIRNNVLNSGLGAYTQSIFMRNEEVDQGRAGDEMFYRNVLIEGNVIINAHLYGISLGETDGLIIRRNTVLHNARSDGDKPNPGLWTPQIRVTKRSRNVRIQDNVTHKITGYEEQADWLVSNNFIVQDRSSKQPNYYNAVFVAALSGDPRDLASFQYLPNGDLAGTEIGAPMLEPGATQILPEARDTLRAPIIRTLPDPDIPNRIVFDITQSSRDLGLNITDQNATWDFGDGKTATGLRVTHDYARPGAVVATLTIDMPDGQTLKNTARVKPRNTEVVMFDSKTGIVSSYVTDPPIQLDLPILPGPIQMGGNAPLITLSRQAIAPFFGARNFVLQTRIRSSGGYRAAGTLLHIYKTLVVTVGGRGNISAEFSTETASAVRLSTAPTKVLLGEWVDVSFEYSGAEELFRLRVNGEVVSQGKTSGPIRPLEHWGLALGHPFQPKNTFNGEMESLVLKVGKDDGAAEN